VQNELEEALLRVGEALVDQQKALVVVPPRAAEAGFWFGGGNLARDARGNLWLVGRYRNGGDSRAGIKAGPRGAELALFRADEGAGSFTPALSWLKKDLACDGEEVLSIEGASLYIGEDGAELYVSSEKARAYPEHVRDKQKPGTGVWSIDVLAAPDVEGLRDATPQCALRSDEAAWLHVKDPVVFDLEGRRTMLYCAHPYSWSSSNTGYAVTDTPPAEWTNCEWSILERGPAWDVAAFRVTERVPLPAVGVLEDGPGAALYFYDGAECIHRHGGGAPRGYSCEEIGGLAAGLDAEFPRIERLSVERPLFISPHGTGCSRYVSVLDAGAEYLVTWQQSQPDDSQPLVMNRVARAEVEAALIA